MPVKLLNQQVAYEHGGNPFKGLHRWYSRKPLSFSRASVLASLLPEDISLDEFEYLLGLHPELEGLKPDANLRLYKVPPGYFRVGKVHDYCERVWGNRTPTVLDAFAGGGSIPFEAARYGLNVLASDLNPVAVVTMKAAMEYPVKFGPDLQVDIDRWVKWVGDEAEKRLADFFPSTPESEEVVQNYLWAHTVVCPSCQSVVPLSPNWWLSKTSNYAGKGQARKVTSDWYAVKPIPNLTEKRVDFELIKGKKGKGTTIKTDDGEYNPDDYITVSRGVGRCPTCGNIIEDEVIKSQAQSVGLGHQLYAVAYKKGKSSLEFRLSNEFDIAGWKLSQEYLKNQDYKWQINNLIPNEYIINDHGQILGYCKQWFQIFNPRQLLTLVTYVEIINEAKELIRAEYEPEKVEAICTYLALVLDRCVDANCRLVIYNAARACIQKASTQHALNLMWNYPEVNGATELWKACQEEGAKDYTPLCNLFGTKPQSLSLPGILETDPKSIKIDAASADSLYHIADKSVDAVITDPPYYGTIPYADLSDFFYVWMKRTLGDIFPELFWSELTDKHREAVANPSRFRDMGTSADELAAQDYEAKMALAFGEYYRVLRDDGVMTVQFNHKDSGAWDVLTKSLIDAGFEITASWSVSTENPQNLHQAQKNSVSSTVLLVCRKRNPNAEAAWWDDLRPEVANLVEQRAPEFEDNDITGIDLYLSAFGPALNVFSRSYPIYNSSGDEVRPEVAFAEARKAIAAYRFRKLVQTDTQGFDSLTQWYFLAWDAFKAREFPYDEARQLALAIGGFNVSDLDKTHKLLSASGGTCKLLTPTQRWKKRAFSTEAKDFSCRYLVDGIHAIVAIYEEENDIQAVRKFMQDTNLVTNDNFMKAIEVALKAIPRIGDEKKRISEERNLLDLWSAMDEIKAKVVYEQLTISY
ncbi:DNA methylase [Planktothricoides sp. SR001]|nr:DNA methylase [Planktothricoides sp. SR001]